MAEARPRLIWFLDSFNINSPTPTAVTKCFVITKVYAMSRYDFPNCVALLDFKPIKIYLSLWIPYDGCQTADRFTVCCNVIWFNLWSSRDVCRTCTRFDHSASYLGHWNIYVATLFAFFFFFFSYISPCPLRENWIKIAVNVFVPHEFRVCWTYLITFRQWNPWENELRIRQDGADIQSGHIEL